MIILVKIKRLDSANARTDFLTLPFCLQTTMPTAQGHLFLQFTYPSFREPRHESYYRSTMSYTFVTTIDTKKTRGIRNLPITFMGKLASHNWGVKKGTNLVFLLCRERSRPSDFLSIN